jgi:hypothetical protein
MNQRNNKLPFEEQQAYVVCHRCNRAGWRKMYPYAKGTALIATWICPDCSSGNTTFLGLLDHPLEGMPVCR